MASDNKELKWKLKNSICFIFAFIPVFNSIPFFYMCSKIKNKKWEITGWILVLIQVILIVVGFLTPSIDGPNCPMYSNVEHYVSEKDYMNKDQRLKFSYENEFIYSSEWKLSDEYANYLKAVDEYEKRREEWEKQPEIIAQFEKCENFRSTQGAISIGVSIALFIIWFFASIKAFSERPRYLNLLKQDENKSSVADRIKSVAKNAIEGADDKKEPIRSNDIKQIDINSADEKEISSLQGVTIIDAKKAVVYRDEHSGFNTVDEFFACIKAKPHIIALLENKVFVGDYKNKKPQNTDNIGKRTIDI